MLFSRFFTSSLLAFSLLTIPCASTAQYAFLASDETPYLDHEVLVMFQQHVSGDEGIEALSRFLDVEVLSVPSPSAKIYHLHIAGEDWLASLQSMRENRAVKAVQLNHVVYERATTPNDPGFGQQWHHVQSGDHDIDSDEAWDITTGGSTAGGTPIVVAVLEGGGSNYSHTDLIDNHWTNAGEIPNNGIDDDNNGYVDDYDGWNVGSGNDAIGTGGHGTSVSGMIGAKGNNNNGGAGVNWDVDIMQVDMAGGLTESNVIAAYEYPKVMRDMFNASGGSEGAFVVATNASWGIDQANPANYPVWCAYYDELGASGILNCGATANVAWDIDVVGDMPTGCSSDYMVAVTATNSNDVRTFSGYGTTSIDLGAPGESVYLPSGSSGYGNTSGTSFASPCVAGAIALVYSIPCPDLAELAIANPQGAADLVLGYLYDGVDLVPNLLTEVATGGRLNVANSVNLAMAGCGPVECDIESFTATSSCVYDMESDTVLTIATLEATFSNFLCSADILCYKDSASTAWTCDMLANSGQELSNASAATLSGLMPNTAYEVYFVLDTVVSDTIGFTTPDCGVLIPGCTDPNALNYDDAATIDDGSCEFPCSDVVFTVTTDCWPEEVGWTITTEAGEVLVEVVAETYAEEQAEEVWSGCLANGCHTLTITDAYGDGMFGSQWSSCDVDGNYVLTTPEGAVMVQMADPDYGSSISHEFCLPAVPGCTLETACNYNAEANADDASCFSVGDACDDGDDETVLDAYNADCACEGVPAVPGCIDEAACNFDAAANVDDGTCYYVAQGTIAGAQTATDMTTETYSYAGDAANTYDWSVTGGSIDGATSGVGLLSVDVTWSSVGTGTVSVIETDPTGCSGEVQLNVDLLVNSIDELQQLGVSMYPNPATAFIYVSLEGANTGFTSLELVDASGRVVNAWPVVDTQLQLDVTQAAAGLYSLRFVQRDGSAVAAPVLLAR